MTILAIETSGSRGFAALAQQSADEELPGCIQTVSLASGERRHASNLVAEIDRLLKGANLKPADLRALVVGTGPGSFTGLRVGITVAKTLAFSLQIPIAAVPTFEILAAGFATGPTTTNARLLVVSDAQRGRLFAQAFQFSTEGFVPESEIAIKTVDEVATNFDGFTVLSDGSLRSSHPAHARLELSAAFPVAKHLVRIGRERIEKGATSDPSQLVPIYGGPSVAEVQWNLRAKSKPDPK